MHMVCEEDEDYDRNEDELEMFAVSAPLSVTQQLAYNNEIYFANTMVRLVSECCGSTISVQSDSNGACFALPNSISAADFSNIAMAQTEKSTVPQRIGDTLVSFVTKPLYRSARGGKFTKKVDTHYPHTPTTLFPEQELIRQHASENEHAITLTCLEAIEDFYYATQLSSESYTESKIDASFPCGFCKEVLDNNINYLRHVHKNHLAQNYSVVDDTLISCRICHELFPQPSAVYLHSIKSHDSENPLRCLICDMEFPTPVAFVLHLEARHSRHEMPYVCQLCGFRSSYNLDINYHFMTFHLDAPNLLCVRCQRVFHYSGRANQTHVATVFERHVREHCTSSHDCSNCLLTFTHEKQRDTHMIIDHQPGASRTQRVRTVDQPSPPHTVTSVSTEEQPSCVD